jgi:hypothetical protein
MNTEEKDLYQMARDRMSNIYQFDEDQLAFIFADWNEPEHLEWLLSASLKEIIEWGEAGNWGME